ncbi:unnamed protein product [Didymodactylos carnosus]|uniref:Uncharacterized protein n=1 Tax=Didymodactylos carnosus TaxID=1234261 RepID=A0A813UF04_9BILA|nr:unnamed protein product [Didymodactylos carnosus]CAF3615249.1 unnamed protein product [Didymodactylos carnosus]
MTKNNIEKHVDVCCGLGEIKLTCSQNEKIRLNIIQLYYTENCYLLESNTNSSTCCKRKSSCSRRITKYSHHCNEQQECFIEKTCLKIYKPCAIRGIVDVAYGQYMTIDYFCIPQSMSYQQYMENKYRNMLPLLPTFDTNITVQLQKPSSSTGVNGWKTLTVTDTSLSAGAIRSKRKNLFSLRYDDENGELNDDNSSWSQWKSSVFSLMLLILFAIIFLLLIYWIASKIGHRLRHRQPSKETLLGHEETKETTITTTLDPINIENYSYKNGIIDSDAKTRIYASPDARSFYYTPYDHSQNQRYPTKCYVNVEHDHRTGQIYSRTLQNAPQNPYSFSYRIPSYRNHNHGKIYLNQYPEKITLT